MSTRKRLPAAAVRAQLRSLDAETRVTDDHHDSLRVWLRLLACSNSISIIVRQRLQEKFSVTLPRFDLLAQLERAPRGLKMGEITRRLMVTGGNVTGIVDALEGEGLVIRMASAEDRRAFRVKLTPAGVKQFKRMAAEHERWIIDLFARLSARQKQQLVALLAVLKNSIAANG
jgi:DNA-binding MarR family transcriptional regulator